VVCGGVGLVLCLGLVLGGGGSDSEPVSVWALFGGGRLGWGWVLVASAHEWVGGRSPQARSFTAGRG